MNIRSGNTRKRGVGILLPLTLGLIAAVVNNAHSAHAAVPAAPAAVHAVPTARFTAADDAAVRKEIEAQYGKIETAFTHKDVGMLETLLAPDFRARLQKKNIDRAAMLKSWKAWFSNLDSVTSQSHPIKSLNVKGDRAIAEVQWIVAYRERGKKGVLQNGTENDLSRDTWVRTDDGWKWQRGEIVPKRGAKTKR